MSVSLLSWDAAIDAALSVVNESTEVWGPLLKGSSLVLLRDWPGRVHLCVPGTEDHARASPGFLQTVSRLHEELGPLSSAAAGDGDLVSGLVLFKDDLYDPGSIWDTEDRSLLQAGPVEVYLIDRQDKEADWLRPPLPRPENQTARAAFFGVKGGVGRSTALVGLALHLGQLGKKVLVVDADFESPGLSSSLMGPDARPDFGIVDWFAADALDEDAAKALTGLGGMVEASPLNKHIPGRILVAPAFGAKSEAYVSKLGRVYAPIENRGPYAERLAMALSQLEAEHSPDVTLIDSRAGIDDTAAVAITRLGARAFLFAVNTTQTWEAYGLLFKHLQRHPTIHGEQDFRPSFRVISALTPDPAIVPGYFEALRQRAYDLFQELYDEIPPGEDGLDAFNFDFDDSDAPHNPWRVRWDDSLRAFDPVRFEEHMNRELQARVFGEFVSNAAAWLEAGQ